MPRKKLKQTKKVSTSRIQPLIDKLTGVEDPDDLMVEIMEALPETVDSTEVEVGNFCTFVYQPKTPFIKYDQNPLVAVVAKYNWGFRGINYHWGSYRNSVLNSWGCSTDDQRLPPRGIFPRRVLDVLRCFTFGYGVFVASSLTVVFDEDDIEVLRALLFLFRLVVHRLRLCLLFLFQQSPNNNGHFAGVREYK